MPDDAAAHNAAPQDDDEDQELELLEEVVRQAEARLTALAQARQTIVAKATTLLTWMLTLLLALTAGLASTSGSSPAKGPLVLLWTVTGLSVVGAAVAVIGNAWPKAMPVGPWQHAGSNPRTFIPEIPVAARKITPGERLISHLGKPLKALWTPFRTSKPSQTQPATPPRNKKDALRDTATRYAQAIDANEQNLAAANTNIAAPLGAILISVLAVLPLSGFLTSTSPAPTPPATPATSPPATPPTAPSAAPPPAKPPAIPDTPPPNPTAPSTPGTGAR